MAKEDFDIIMQKITAGLTGDHDKDVPYLQDKCEEYKNHKYAKEIYVPAGGSYLRRFRKKRRRKSIR